MVDAMLQGLQASLRIALLKLLFQTRAGLTIQYQAEAREATRPVLDFVQLVKEVLLKQRVRRSSDSLPLGILTLARDILPNTNSAQNSDQIQACVGVVDSLALAYIEGSRRDPRYTQLFANISRTLVDLHEYFSAVTSKNFSNGDPVWLATLQAASITRLLLG